MSDVRDTDIDLLPSSLDLIDVQDQLATIPSGRFYSINPIELLWRTVKTKLDDYDIVLVDCPPNLGIITLNGLRISTVTSSQRSQTIFQPMASLRSYGV